MDNRLNLEEYLRSFKSDDEKRKVFFAISEEMHRYHNNGCYLGNLSFQTVSVCFTNSTDIKFLYYDKIGKLSLDDVLNHKDDVDVLVMCGGSATDLPEQTPAMAEHFNVVDSFDTHKRIPEHFSNVDAAAKNGGKIGIISVGWDPGMFSLNRLYGSCILPDGADYTFWGKGVSQGHSDAIRRVEGVIDARQYTIPVEEALEAVRSGSQPQLTTRQKHTRECFVVAEEGADKARIEKEIRRARWLERKNQQYVE